MLQCFHVLSLCYLQHTKYQIKLLIGRWDERPFKRQINKCLDILPEYYFSTPQVTPTRLVLLVLLSLFLFLDGRLCAGGAEPGYGLSRQSVVRMKERVLNLIPQGGLNIMKRFPFFSFGGSTAPGQCGCKCEFRQVRIMHYKNLKSK